LPLLPVLLCFSAQMQQLSNSKTSLQGTIQRVQDSNALLQDKLSTLRGMVSTMASDNHQLQAANSELREQVQAVVLHLQQNGIPVPDLGF
jgi:regulator of replication initiation timing